MDIALPTDTTRRQVHLDQVKELVKFVREHQDIAKGLSRSRKGKLNTPKLWNLCAAKLNEIQDGVVKDGKAWSKYWCDLKYRVRRRAVTLKTSSDSSKDPPEGVPPLSEIERDVLNILDNSGIDGASPKSECHIKEGSENEDSENEDKESSQQDKETKMPARGIKRSKSSQYTSSSSSSSSSSDSEDLDGDGTSSSSQLRPTIIIGNKDGCVGCNKEGMEFLRIERQKLEYTKKTLEYFATIAQEITRLADVMTQIKEELENKESTDNENEQENENENENDNENENENDNENENENDNENDIDNDNENDIDNDIENDHENDNDIENDIDHDDENDNEVDTDDLD